jgi:hypothetical protein
MGPAAQRRNASLDQYIDGRAVAVMRSLQQLESRLDVVRLFLLSPLLVAHSPLITLL